MVARLRFAREQLSQAAQGKQQYQQLQQGVPAPKVEQHGGDRMFNPAVAHRGICHRAQAWRHIGFAIKQAGVQQ